jgi:hypothetical protein
MVRANLSRRQCGSSCFTSKQKRRVQLPALFATLPLILLLACRTSTDGTYRGTTSDRVIELKSGTAYITEGNSSQAVPYEVAGDRIVLKMPFMNTVLRKMPDGALAGMGETLIKIDESTAALLGTYESSEGEYRLRLSTQGRAVYTRLGRSFTATYTISGDQITLNRGDAVIPVKRRSDGSLETPDGVLKKQS